MKKASINLKSAKLFLKLLNHEIYTFQYLKEGKPYGSDCWRFDEIDWKKLENLNRRKKAEIFIMVNEGDGIVHEGYKLPRSSKSVKGLTALFIDTDEAPLSAVQEFAKNQKLKPHLVVETSPGKFHIYFLLDSQSLHLLHNQRQSVQPSNQAKQLWKSLQLKLSHLGKETPQADSSTQDISRVLRVPGFLHLKNPDNPFPVQIRRVYRHRCYTLAELEQALRGCPPEAQALSDGEGSQNHSRYCLPSTKVGPGNRHLEMTRFLGHLLNNGVNLDAALLSYRQFATEYFVDAKDFLPGGKRYHEVESFVNYWKQQQVDESEEAKEKAKEAAKKVLSETAVTRGSNPFELPDEFYMEAPGLVGEMTRYLYNSALYPCAPIAFASSLSFLGLIKSKAQIGPNEATPNNYIMCLAPSGSGKNHAQQVLGNAASELSLRGLHNDVRSRKGVQKFLQANNSRGLLMLDEAEEFLSMLKDDRTPHYLKQVKPLFLELYSSGGRREMVMGQVGDDREKPIILEYPHLSLLVFGVLHVVNEAFTAKTIKDGLLQRFIVVTADGKRKRNRHREKSKSGGFPDHITEQLRELVIKSGQVEEKALLGGDEPKQAQRIRARVRFSPEVEEAFEGFVEAQDERINWMLESGRGYPEIYTRGAEQLERLLVASSVAEGMGGEPVSLAEYEHMETFISTRIKALEACVAEGFKADESRYTAESNQLIRQITTALGEHQAQIGVGMATRKLWHSLRPQPSYRALKEAIGAGAEMGLWSVSLVATGKPGPKAQVVTLNE